MSPSPRISRQPVPSKHTGFTLVELLVVIAILAILVGLLLPVIAVVKEHTRKVQAGSDEKQIVLAITNYFSEYNKYPVDSAAKPGDPVYSTDNNAVLDVLRNVTGSTIGNKMNARAVPYLSIRAASNQTAPRDGLQISTGVWFDPWGSPYNIAVDGNYDNQINSPSPLPNFYSDAGAFQLGAIVWAFGKNGQSGGGPAANSAFSSEPGTPGKFAGSGDVGSW